MKTPSHNGQRERCREFGDLGNAQLLGAGWWILALIVEMLDHPRRGDDIRADVTAIDIGTAAAMPAKTDPRSRQTWALVERGLRA